MHAPPNENLMAALRIVRHLKGATEQGLSFRKTHDRSIQIYTRLIGVVGRLIRGPHLATVTWRSKKHDVVSRSSGEAELHTLALGLCEELWIKQVVTELQQRFTPPIKIYYDNISAINMTESYSTRHA